MKRHIDRIKGVVPNTHKEIDIDLNGRNLIITGSNGSGKTCLLKELDRKVDLLIGKKQLADKSTIERYVQMYKEEVFTSQNGTTKNDRAKNNLESQVAELEKINSGLDITFINHLGFSSKLDNGTAVLSFFEAHRRSNITSANTAKGIETERTLILNKTPNDTRRNQIGNNLEQHLVNLRNRRSLAITEDNDQLLAKKIEQWFSAFEENLKYLLEDETAKLSFNSDTLKFTIFQASKPAYTFQSISSGYQAIFDIYADLLMRTEYFEIIAEELTGLVLIDEIDAHLHVSLQRLVLPFFTRSFPNLQFIVTTHSPFVLMSATDAVIFDLTHNEQIEEDISLYSHTAVMEGLLGTKATSTHLDNYINEVASIINMNKVDYERLELLVGKLKNVENSLDSKSKAFFLKGQNILAEKEL